MLISDPDADPDKILAVNFTTWKPRHDPACIVNIGEHPFIRHQTCVNYREAWVFSIQQLRSLEASGILAWREPLSPVLLDKIRQRAGESELAIDYLNLLVEQGLLRTD
jgi:hypothetical protein